MSACFWFRPCISSVIFAGVFLFLACFPVLAADISTGGETNCQLNGSGLQTLTVTRVYQYAAEANQGLPVVSVNGNAAPLGAGWRLDIQCNGDTPMSATYSKTSEQNPTTGVWTNIGSIPGGWQYSFTRGWPAPAQQQVTCNFNITLTTWVNGQPSRTSTQSANLTIDKTLVHSLEAGVPRDPDVRLPQLYFNVDWSSNVPGIALTFPESSYYSENTPEPPPDPEGLLYFQFSNPTPVALNYHPHVVGPNGILEPLTNEPIAVAPGETATVPLLLTGHNWEDIVLVDPEQIQDADTTEYLYNFGEPRPMPVTFPDPANPTETKQKELPVSPIHGLPAGMTPAYAGQNPALPWGMGPGGGGVFAVQTPSGVFSGSVVDLPSGMTVAGQYGGGGASAVPSGGSTSPPSTSSNPLAGTNNVSNPNLPTIQEAMAAELAGLAQGHNAAEESGNLGDGIGAAGRLAESLKSKVVATVPMGSAFATSLTFNLPPPMKAITVRSDHDYHDVFRSAWVFVLGVYFTHLAIKLLKV